ncbi:MAG: hypothetical protein ABJA67_01965 [Chthonomonadales bacterium]
MEPNPYQKQTNPRFSMIMRILVPLGLSITLLKLEPVLGQLAQERPGIVPVSMVALIAGFLLPFARRWLIVTLCFGVGLLALRDTFGEHLLPAAVDFVFVNRVYPFGWGALAILAFSAGVGEAIHPGSIWARRCYFGAAALYFLGHGVVSFIKVANYQSVILMMVGLVALSGVFMADRVVEAENEEEDVDEDIQAINDRQMERISKISSKEWKEH